MPLSVEAALFDRVSDGIPVADPQWVFVFVNEAGARMLGGAANELLGRRIEDVVFDFAGTAFERNFRYALERQEVVEFDDFIARFGRLPTVRLFASADGLTANLPDSSAPHAGDRALEVLLAQSRRQHRLAKVLAEANEALFCSTSPSELFAAAVRIAVEDGGFVMSWIGLFDSKRGDITPIAWAGEAATEELENLRAWRHSLALWDLAPGPTSSGGHVLPWGADVIEVMDRVVEEVAHEACRAETGAVAAPSGSRPLPGTDRRDALGDRAGRGREFGRDPAGVLGAVAVGGCGGVLVPIGELGVLGIQDEGKTPIHHLADVADMARVFKCGPAILHRALAQRRIGGRCQYGNPGPRHLADQRTDSLWRDRARVEAALMTGPLEHPCPVLGVGHDFHRATGRCMSCDAASRARRLVARASGEQAAGAPGLGERDVPVDRDRVDGELGRCGEAGRS